MSEITNIFSAWWLTYPPEKYESVGMMTFPIYGTIKMFQTTNQSSMFIEDEYLAACPVCVHSMWHYLRNTCTIWEKCDHLSSSHAPSAHRNNTMQQLKSCIELTNWDMSVQVRVTPGLSFPSGWWFESF